MNAFRYPKSEIAREQHFQALKREDFESMTLAELSEFNARREQMVTLAKRSAVLITEHESERRTAKRSGIVIPQEVPERGVNC